MEIEGKVALVTGAAKRVGREIALGLAEGGAQLVVHYRTSAKEAQEVVARIKALGGKPIAVQGDLSRAAEAEAVVEAAMAAFGRIDILVNSAAVFFRTPFGTLTEDDWDAIMDTNLKGPFLLCRRVGEIMLGQGSGKIINIADVGAYRPWADYIPYCVAKAGLIALTQGLARALAPTVQVNAVAPGPVLLPEGTTEEERDRIIRRTPLKRLGSPEDVARTVRFLIEGSDFITGEVVAVDGGAQLL